MTGRTRARKSPRFVRDRSGERAAAALRVSEERYRELFENAHDAIYVHDLNGVITACNRAVEKLTGYGREEALGMNIDRLVAPETWSVLQQRREEILAGKYNAPGGWDGGPYEGVMITKSGERVLVEVSTQLIFHRGKPVAVQGIARDITHRKRAEQLHAKLQGRDLFLREIHHRVKNNLQLIVSLLHLQSAYAPDPRTAEMFRESENRVRSMSIIHNALYRRGKKDVLATDYLGELANQVMRSYRTNPGISLETDIGEVVMGIDTAIPCGLILNELVSNALKYAFSDGRRGCIRVTLALDGDSHCVLAVADDGIGLPAGFDPRAGQTLGYQLITSLTEQLRGSLAFGGGPGTTVVVRFERGTEERRMS